MQDARVSELEVDVIGRSSTLSTRLIGSIGFCAIVAAVACGSSSSRTGFDQDGTDPASGGGTGNNAPAGSLGTDGADAATPEPSDECQKMDLVFIVDDSGSMSEEQANLAHNFPKFVKVLNDYQTKSGAKLDWRAAITTTGRDVTYNITPPIPFPIPIPPSSEKGDNGAFRQKKDCGSLRRWVERNDPDADETFSCLAEVGTGGPSIEMPLESLKLALNDRVTDGTNTGFLRPDALLAVVILTDEDDCSREDDNFSITDDVCITMPGVKPIADYKAMIDNVAGGANRWATAVIAGDKACSSSFGDASDAQRLKQFVNLVGKNGMFSSICNGDLTTSLQDALNTFDAACKTFPGVK